MGLSADAVFYGATALTAITDNAALTYLASLVPGLSDEFKVAIVAGAVTGGGLTVIANAPNPAGVAILKGKFDEGVVNAGRLLLAALPPTLIAALSFRAL
jgi:predicted cation transporter